MTHTPYISAIESKGWCLYDASTDELQLENWEEREARRRPVTAVEAGGMYVFVPQPTAGQTLRQAYAVTGGIGPCLRIGNVEDDVYRVLALRFSPRLAVFTRFALQHSDFGPEVELFTPSVPKLSVSDIVVLQGETAQTVFERDFDVITPEEFKREIAYAKAEWDV